MELKVDKVINPRNLNQSDIHLLVKDIIFLRDNIKNISLELNKVLRTLKSNRDFSNRNKEIALDNRKLLAEIQDDYNNFKKEAVSQINYIVKNTSQLKESSNKYNSYLSKLEKVNRLVDDNQEELLASLLIQVAKGNETNFFLEQRIELLEEKLNNTFWKQLSRWFKHSFNNKIK